MNLTNLNNDVLFAIMKRVEDVDLQSARKVNHLLNVHATNPFLWKFIKNIRAPQRLGYKLQLPQRPTRETLVSKGYMRGVNTSQLNRGEYIFQSPEMFESKATLDKFLRANIVKKRLKSRPDICELERRNVIPHLNIICSTSPDRIAPKIARMLVKLRRNFVIDNVKKGLSDSKSLEIYLERCCVLEEGRY